jgi:hypothetical protein
VSADTPQDRDLEDLLAEAAARRQQYRVASQEQPPVALDEAIRAAARREVGARPLTIGSGFGGSWRVPASIAAVVVVSVTVAVMVSTHDSQLVATKERPSSGAPARVGAAKDQTESASDDRTVKQQREVDAAKATLQARPLTAVPASSAPAPAEARVEKSELAAKIESPIARTASEREEPLRAQTPAKTALPAVAETPAPATAPNATAAPSPAPEAAAKATADGALSGQVLTKRRAVSNFGEAESKASPWEKDPQTWLAHIEELRVAGRTQDAEASFRAFRGRYPDYQLPAGFVPPVPPISN